MSCFVQENDLFIIIKKLHQIFFLLANIQTKVQFKENVSAAFIEIELKNKMKPKNDFKPTLAPIDFHSMNIDQNIFFWVLCKRVIYRF